MYRPELEGIENLPENSPYMLVANHSAGMGAAEVFSFALLYLEEVGIDRPLAGMAHPFGFSIWPISAGIKSVGAIPSTSESVLETLGQGIPILLFPGGDYESCRPIWQANKVTFAGRKGFLKLAREAQVPIVPMGIRGAHYTAPILWRSEWLLPWLLILPRVIGIKRFPLSLFGLVGAVAIACLGPIAGWPLTAFLIWFWLGSPYPFLPIVPAKIRMKIGAPIPPEELFDEDDTELVEAYERVEAAVQEQVRRSE